jgi:hypothetical protein
MAETNELGHRRKRAHQRFKRSAHQFQRIKGCNSMSDKRLRYSIIALFFPATLLAACSSSPSRPSAGPIPVAAAPRPNFSLDTPVDVIAANPKGKAVLDHDIPGLMASRSYVLFDDMSLTQIATVSGGRLTKTKLALVQTDLSQLSDAPP